MVRDSRWRRWISTWAAGARLCIEGLKQHLADGRTMDELFSLIAYYLVHHTEVPLIGSHPDMSSTLSVLRLSGRRAFVGHVGDTRITHYRGESAIARTHDQTELQKLLDDGVISKFQGRRYPRKSVILSSMRPGRIYTLFESEFSVQCSDRLLLTSGGFHNNIQAKFIAESSRVNLSFDAFFRSIASQMFDVGSDDDATCLAIEIG